jgi:hypothetical protein
MADPDGSGSQMGFGRLATTPPCGSSAPGSWPASAFGRTAALRQCRALIYFNSCMDMSYAWIAAFARAATSATIIPGL